MLKIYNSLTRSKQDFVPLTPGKAGLYVCGMTVYDYCHLGHARVMVVFDMVVRWLQVGGLDVNYVRNITDIDDKIIKRSQENNEPIEALTDRFIRAMDEDAASDLSDWNDDKYVMCRHACMAFDCNHISFSQLML